MRYLFRGLIRDSGRPVEGHVEAESDGDAFNALSQNGVVTESLVPDPRPLDLNAELPSAPQFADALESAFDSSSSQVDFDALSERYTGKKVWVIDRDKIRRRVAQVVDAALALAAQHEEGASKTRERVHTAIAAMFEDNRNLATERNADSIAGVRFNGGFAPPPPAAPAPTPPAPVSRVSQYLPPANGGGNGGAGHPGLENQVARMANLVKQAESALAAIHAAARQGGFGGGGGGGGRRKSVSRGGRSEEQNGVLLEIFKSNLNLVRSLDPPAPAAEPVEELVPDGAPEAVAAAGPNGE